MALRFRRSVKIAPGIRMNLSKSGIGISAGVRGVRVGVNRRGTYSSVGIPGTGIYSVNQSSSRRSVAKQPKAISNNIPSRQLKTTMSTTPAWIIVFGLLSLIISVWFGIFLLGVGLTAVMLQRKNPEFEARNAIIEGIKAYEKFDYSNAIIKFNSAREVLPHEVALYYHLGLSCLSNKQNEEAVNYFNKYIELAPIDADAKLLLALSHKEVGETGKAIGLLQSLSDMGEELNIEKLILLADCFKIEGKIEIAIDTLKQAPLRKKKLTNSLLRVCYALGELYEISGKQKYAKKYFEKVYMQDTNFDAVEEKLKKLECV